MYSYAQRVEQFYDAHGEYRKQVEPMLREWLLTLGAQLGEALITGKSDASSVPALELPGIVLGSNTFSVEVETTMKVSPGFIELVLYLHRDIELPENADIPSDKGLDYEQYFSYIRFRNGSFSIFSIGRMEDLGD